MGPPRVAATGRTLGAGASNIAVPPAQFSAATDEIRSLTTASPEVFWPRMQALCAAAGVVLIAVPHLPKTGANGVARWLDPGKAMIQLNLRYRWADIFWFTFFHEAAT